MYLFALGNLARLDARQGRGQGHAQGRGQGRSPVPRTADRPPSSDIGTVVRGLCQLVVVVAGDEECMVDFESI
jgi:hypothetical protein